MPLPESSRKDVEAMPAALRALLEAEIAAGNDVIEVGHSFPAPPVGAYFRLAKPLQSRAQESGDGIVYYDRNSSLYSGEITDEKRYFFLLEPPHPPEPEPDMDAIRAARDGVKTPQRQSAARTKARIQGFKTAEPDRPKKAETLLSRFEASMVIDYDKWHDGIGYEVNLLSQMSPEEQTAARSLLLAHGIRDWRDVEALAFFDTPEVRDALLAAMKNSNAEIRNAVTQYAPALVSDSARTASLLKALKSAKFFEGLSQTLDQVEDFHPAPIVDELFRGVLKRDGTTAVHFAAMLCYIHGKAPEPFDMAQRPFFLRFNTENRAERETAFRELCEKIEADPSRYIADAAR